MSGSARTAAAEVPRGAERLPPVPPARAARVAGGAVGKLLVEVAEQELAGGRAHGSLDEPHGQAWRAWHQSSSSDPRPAVMLRSAPIDCLSARTPAASGR